MAKARGGRRVGAGRKPMLRWQKRLLLGADAEKQLGKAAEARLYAKVAARNERLNLEEKWARLGDVPRRERRARLANPDDEVAETVLDVRDAVEDLYDDK